MKRLLGSVGALILGAVFPTASVHAQFDGFVTRDAGFYWRADVGASIPRDGHITEFGPWDSGQKLTYDAGFSLDTGFGYFFNKYVATELELGWTWNSLDSVEGGSAHDTSFGSTPILANVIFQYQIPRTRLIPYIGGGVGGAVTYFDADGFYQRVPGGSVTLYGSDVDFVFAWQGLAGARFELNDKMFVGLSYHYLHLDSSTFGFDSWYHGGPDLNIGFSEHETHVIALTFLMKF